MAWYAVWENADGRLDSTGTLPPDPVILAERNKSFADFGTPQDVRKWNPVAHDFSTPLANPASILDPQRFWNRWTPAERQTLYTFIACGRLNPPATPAATVTPSANQVQMGEFAGYAQRAHTIDCNDAYIQASVNAAETFGILAAGRAAVILA